MMAAVAAAAATANDESGGSTSTNGKYGESGGGNGKRRERTAAREHRGSKQNCISERSRRARISSQLQQLVLSAVACAAVKCAESS